GDSCGRISVRALVVDQATIDITNFAVVTYFVPATFFADDFYRGAFGDFGQWFAICTRSSANIYASSGNGAGNGSAFTRDQPFRRCGNFAGLYLRRLNLTRF